MAKVGDQYIITIDSKMTNHNGNLYTASGMKTLVFDDEGLSKLVPFTDNVGYGRGMLEMYEASKTISRMKQSELKRVFNTIDMQSIFNLYKPKEIIYMMKDYRKNFQDNYNKVKKLAEEIGEDELKRIAKDL